MKLEKCSRCGGEARFVSVGALNIPSSDNEGAGAEILLAVRCEKCGKRTNTFPVQVMVKKDGGLSESGLDYFDIAADTWNKENTPDDDWDKVPVDTPIYVRDKYDNPWRKAHFAKYENGKVYAWDGGRTSFTSEKLCSWWKRAKLAEEKEE